MTATTPPPPRRSCLFGCLLLLAIALLPLALVVGYGTWFMADGFRRDPAVQAAHVLLQNDSMAQMVLGNDIRITGVEGNAFSFMSGLGSRNDTRLVVEGSKGSGTLDIETRNVRGRLRLDSAILSGPDGGLYDLLRQIASPPANIGNSI